MRTFLKEHGKTVVVAMITAAVTASAPTVAGTIADYARNADKVDGRHAVGARASVENRKGKLVATSGTTGKLPTNILNLTAYQKRCKAGAVLAYARIDTQEATSELSTTGVATSFNCTGGGALVQNFDSADGVFYVRFPGLMGGSNVDEEYVALANVDSSYYSVNVQPWQVNVGSESNVPVMEVDLWNVVTDVPEDADFSIMLFRVIR